MKIGIILTPDIRSKAYLQKLIKNKIFLNELLFMNDKRKEPNFSEDIINKSQEFGFNISKPVLESLTQSGMKFKIFPFVDINHPKLVDYLSKCSSDIFIFTGGGILRKEVLNCGPKFVHFHPGIAPTYRGSTCFYYSILNEDKCGATAYFMDDKLDTGDIIYQRDFQKPNHQYVDEVYDSFIRSETLIDVLKNRRMESKKFKKQNPRGETYYIIHPVLKHISILSCTKV